MNFEAPLTSLVWLTSIVSVVITYIVSYLLIPDLGDGTLWWKLSTIITCGTLAGAIIPEVIKVFTSTNSGHVREMRRRPRRRAARRSTSSSGLTAGNFSAYWMGLVIVGLMGIAYLVSLARPRRRHARRPAADAGAGGVRLRPGRLRLPRHGAGDHRGRLLRSGDRQRPVGLRAVADRDRPEHQAGVKKDFGFDVDFEKAKDFLEENDGAGNTFKATAKPVLIGTAVVGATTMIFSIIMALTHGLTGEPRQAVDPPPAVPARPDHWAAR